MVETRPVYDTVDGPRHAAGAFLVGPTGAALGGLFVTDITQYPDRVDVNVDGLDTDVLIAADGTKRHFVFYGWFQPSADVTLTFKSGVADIAPPVFVPANEVLIIGDLSSPLAEHWTGAGEAYSVQKSAAVTLKGQLFKKTV